jgi:hypothetical protein
VTPAIHRFGGGTCDVDEIAATPDGLQLIVTACLDAYALDTATYTPTLLGASRQFSAFCNPGGVAITPDGKTAFVPDSECGGILAIDTTTHIHSTFFLPGNSQPTARYIAITSDGTRAYTSGFDNCCAQGGDGIVGVFDPVTKIGLASIDVGSSRTFGIAVLPLNNTPVGPNVAVQPLDKIGTSPVMLTFDNVTQAGFTSLVTSTTGPPPPTGFQVAGVYYNLSTTAQFTGNITICITSLAVTSSSQLWHFGSLGPVDVTSLPVTPPTICGIVTSLSPFAVLQAVVSPVSIALSSSVNPSVPGQSVTFTATVSAAAPGAGTPTGNGQFEIDGTNFGPSTALVNGMATSPSTSALTPGSHIVTFLYAGDTNFLPGTGALTQIVGEPLVKVQLLSHGTSSAGVEFVNLVFTNVGQTSAFGVTAVFSTRALAGGGKTVLDPSIPQPFGLGTLNPGGTMTVQVLLDETGTVTRAALYVKQIYKDLLMRESESSNGFAFFLP